MEITRKLFRVLTGLMLCIQGAFAQHDHFKNIGPEQGFPQAVVYKAVEDSLGYIWFTTSRGIMQYDGKTFREYGAKDGLTENTFYLVSRVPGTNTLYFISNSYKLFVFDKGKFRRISSRNDLCWITYDGAHKPYILTRRGHIFTLENEKLVPFYLMTRWTSIHYQLHWINGKNFILNNDFGVDYQQGSTKRFSLMQYPYSTQEQYQERCHKLSNGRVFVSNYKGFYELDTASRQMKCLFPINRSIVYCAILDEKNNDVLVGSSEGLWVFRNGNMDLAHRECMLPGKYVFDVIRTSEGMIVSSTYADGIFLSMMRAKHFDEKEGLKDVNIRFVNAQDTDMYLISEHTNMHILKKDKLIPFDHGNKIVMPNIPNFAISDSKALIVGFTIDRSQVMRIRNRKVSVFKKHLGHALTLSHVDEDPIYFMGSYNEEKNISINLRYNEEGFKFIENNAINPSVSYLMLIDTKKQRYYYAKDQGYIRQDLALPPDSLKFVDLGSDVEFMLKMNDELMVAGTYNNGLALITDTSTFMLKPGNGLSGIRCIKGIKVNDCLWVLTDQGVSRITFTPQGKIKNITGFNANNVLKSETLNDFFLYDGMVYVAGKQGLSVFGQDLSLTRPRPFVDLTGFNINNTDTTLLDAYELPYDHNNITVTYKYPSLLNSGKAHYRYVLTRGTDTLTDNITPDEKLQLYSLASGSYVLSLWAMNANGEWSTLPRTVKFYIAPVFWKTWWFITFILFLVLAVVIVIAMYRVRVNQRESRLKNRLTESELRALRLHMNPHFIFNTLNSLQRFVLKGNPLTANDYIARLSQLIRWIMEYSDKEELNLQEEIDFLSLYIELEQFRFEKAFECSIIIAPELNTYDLFIPSLTIQPFVENAVKYGLSGRTQGRLVISFSKHDAYLGVVIEDNGVGREQVKKEQELSGKEKSSTGISYTEERLKLLIGDERVKPVKIFDLYNQYHQATGTRVELLIPVLS